MNGQFERDYRDGLDGLRFSGEDKERMMKNLMEQQERKPEKRRSVRPLRIGLIAAAACLALMGTAVAANEIAKQTKTYFINSEEEKQEVLERELTKEGSWVGISGGYCGQEYVSNVDERENWWNAYGAMPIIEEVTGTEEDGWTKMRTFWYKTPDFLGAEDVFQKRYIAESLSGFDSLWISTPWDLTWLEEHYTPVPNGQGACVSSESITIRFSCEGEFQGENGTAFRLYIQEEVWPIRHDTDYQMTEGYDYTELYQTRDGVEVTVKMATSPSGKSVFWADLTAGHYRFDMEGMQMEIDEIHDILDSLNLSVLLDYTPKS